MPFTIKTEGGPFPGVRFYEQEDLEKMSMSWPLPEILAGTEAYDGQYVKISESQLPAEAAGHPNVGVGAVYEWQEKKSDD